MKTLVLVYSDRIVHQRRISLEHLDSLTSLFVWWLSVTIKVLVTDGVLDTSQVPLHVTLF